MIFYTRLKFPLNMLFPKNYTKISIYDKTFHFYWHTSLRQSFSFLHNLIQKLITKKFQFQLYATVSNGNWTRTNKCCLVFQVCQASLLRKNWTQFRGEFLFVWKKKHYLMFRLYHWTVSYTFKLLFQLDWKTLALL